MIQIEKASVQDLDGVEKLYNESVHYLETHINYPGWKCGIYPAREDAETAISEDSLYVVKENVQIIGSFILRHKPEDGYKKADWGIELGYDQIYVIDTFVIHPSVQRNGIGQTVMKYIIERSRREQMRAIRLDVVADNLPAIRLYEKAGFQYITTVDLGYGMFGLHEFALYQLLL
ncbi:MAG: GNAT family N-acetyltransferase [Lachnospiraceae bacterium]|nr:GNAT family N-acetyltransferase [Lachnospiraceae bacterium]